MKRIYILSFVFAAGLFVQNAVAQNLDPTVEVSRAYEGKIMEATKPVRDVNVPDSVGTFRLDFDYAVFENFKQYVGETGVGYARIQSGWNKTEREAGKYEFEWLDRIVDGLLEEGVQPWMCLSYGNTNYMENVRDLYTFVNDEEAMTAWEKYVKATVRRYKDRVKMWEVWNEPDFSSKKYTAEYAVLFARTAKAVKAADPKAKVAIFALSDLDKPYAGIVLEKLKELNKGTDIAAIKAATEEVQKAFYAASEKLYQQANPQGAQGAQGGYQQPGDDGVVDADYETVD